MHSKKLKVVHIVPGLLTGGAEVVLGRLVEHQDQEKFESVVISLTSEGELAAKLRSYGARVHCVGMGSRWRAGKDLFNLIKLLRSEKPNVVHTWLYKGDLIGGIAARLAGVSKVLWSIHQSNLATHLNSRSTLLAMRLCALLSRHIPAAIVSCSHAGVRTHIDAGYAPESMRVIPNGFDLDRFMPDRAHRLSVRKELGVSAFAPLVGLIARFDPQKNHAGFIAAARHIKDRMPTAVFVMAGAGIDLSNEALRKLISEAQLADSTFLLGRREDVPRLIASLDVLVSTSHGEAFPSVIGESLACGVPCVVTDVGDCAEIVGNPEWVAEPGAMEDLAQKALAVLRMDARERDVAAATARERVRRLYEIGLVTRQYERVYEQLAAESSVCTHASF